MYHLRSQSAVTRFKLASWLLFFKWLLIPSAIAVLMYSVITIDRQLAHLAAGMFATALLVGVIQWAISTRAHCPLCLAPPIAHRCCSKHRKAKRLLGSYRLRVACTVIFRNYFRCPYCGEPTAIGTSADSPQG